MNPAASPLYQPRSQGMAVSKKVIDDPMAPDINVIEADDDIFNRPFNSHPAAERTLESNRDTMVMTSGSSGGSGISVLLSPFAWLNDKLMSSAARVRISGSAKAIYSLTVRSVMGARAQMESYSPPAKGEFSQKLSLKWGVLRPNLLLRGQFFIAPAQGLAGRAGEYGVDLRARLPLLPVLPWIAVASLPAIVPVLINLIIGFSWHGPALAAGWVALMALPMVVSYISTARSATKRFATAIASGLTEEALIASANDRSSIIALVPARPVMTDQDDDDMFDAVMPVRAKPAAAKVQKPVPMPVSAVAAKPPVPVEPVSAELKPVVAKPAEPTKPMTMDAQALVKAQMAAQVQNQLEAQLEALNKAEIELKTPPKAIKPPRPVSDTPAVVSSARVRSRIKKFRTRYDVASKPVSADQASDSGPDSGPAPKPALEAATPQTGYKVKV